MAEIQWIKLKVDMFDNEKIKLIEAMPDADSILVIWIKLLTYAGKVNSSGYILLTENIPMNEEELATIFNRPLNTIRYALQIFERYGMVERDNDAIRIKNWGSHQNVEGMDKIKEQNRIRKQRQREKKKEELPEIDKNKDSHVTSRDGHATEGEREEELEEDIDIDKEREREAKDSLSYNQEVYDILSDRGVDMSNAQSCFNISRKLSDIDDIQYLNKAIDIAEKKGVKKAPYVLRVIENWFEDGKETYQKLMEHEQRHSNKKEDDYQLTPEQQAQIDQLGF